MKTRLLKLSNRSAVAALLAVLAFSAARADESDPPGRVARLSDVEGTVSLQPAGVQDWTSAALNRPLTTGDKLWTDQNSRAELDLGAAVIRLGAVTGFSFLNLDDSVAQMQVTAGTLIVRVRNLDARQNYEIDSPNLALSLQQPGEYRIEVNDAGDVTTVKVSEGQAQASGGGQSLTVSTQQSATFTGTTELTYETATLGGPDDLDSWSASRERQAEDSPSRQYVADEVAGTQDLDNNGVWESTPDYGYVWMPTAVVVGWAPYRFGHWVWIAPWGWTWVDDAPWGYAPFHYGRWVMWNSAWCWVPGPRRLRPVYAPALVAWVGSPGGVAVGVNVGWFPLAPREVYVPAYPVSQTYVRNVNVTNTTIVNNTYITNVYNNNVTNIRYVNNTPGAVTAVPQNVFSSGQRVGGHTVKLGRAELQRSAVTAAAPAIVPERQSVLGPNAGRPVSRPPAALFRRPVVARTPPPRAPVSFEKQVAAIQENGGRPLARPDIAKLQPATPAARVRLITAAKPGTPSRSRPPTPTAPAATGTTSLGDREHVLQKSGVPPAPRAEQRPPAPPRPQSYGPGEAPRPAAPPPRSDRPPSAPQHVTPAPPQRVTPDESNRPYVRPSPAPVSRPPATEQTPSRRPQPVEPREERYRAPASTAAPPPVQQPARPVSPPPVQQPARPVNPPPVQQPARPVNPPPAPPREQGPPPASRPQEQRPAPAEKAESKSDSRESAHGDRNSRDRVER